MRHTIVTCGVLVLLISIHASAGTVHFNPPSATITPGTQSVSFDVSVSWATLPTIDTVNVLVHADKGVSLEFNYAQSFLDSTSFAPFPAPYYEAYIADICSIIDCLPLAGFGGNRLPPLNGWSSSLMIGTLTVNTSGLHASEQIDVVVDSVWESGLIGAPITLVASGANQEALSGLATITVVPEPTVLAMLGPWMLVALLQRNKEKT